MNGSGPGLGNSHSTSRLLHLTRATDLVADAGNNRSSLDDMTAQLDYVDAVPVINSYIYPCNLHWVAVARPKNLYIADADYISAVVSRRDMTGAIGHHLPGAPASNSIAVDRVGWSRRRGGAQIVDNMVGFSPHQRVDPVLWSYYVFGADSRTVCRVHVPPHQVFTSKFDFANQDIGTSSNSSPSPSPTSGQLLNFSSISAVANLLRQTLARTA